MLEIDISRNYSQKDLGVLGGDYWVFGCPNDTSVQDFDISQKAERNECSN